MTTATALAARISWRIHDGNQEEISAANMLSFLNDAIEDLAGAGWVLPLAEATIAQVAATYIYTVPASFVYIKELRKEDATTASLYNELIPYWAWQISQGASDAQIRLDSRWFTPTAGKNILVIGQKRIAALGGSDTVPAGCLGFIRERATAYAAAYVAGGVSEYAAQRRELAQIAFNISEQMLVNIPDEFKIAAGSRPVPGR
jgi:hypothetical protein